MDAETKILSEDQPLLDLLPNRSCHKGTFGIVDVYVCSSCNLTLKTQWELQNHKKTQNHYKRSLLSEVHNKYHLCDFCGYKAKRKLDVKRHMRSHTGECPYKCYLCPFRTSRRDCLNRHMLSHWACFSPL